MAQSHLIKKVKSSKFNVDHLSQYSLCLLLGKRHFKFCVIDTKTNLCLLLEDYLLDNSDLPRETTATLKELFENHHLLNAGFWNAVKLAVYNSKSVLIPVSLFDKGSLEDYLRINCDLQADDLQLYYKHHKGKLVNVFAANSHIINWFETIYPNLNLHLLHHSSALIEGVSHQEDQSRLRSMAVIVNNEVCDILIHEKGQLLYCNQFTFDGSQEFINYVMIAMEQLELDPNLSKVQIWGDINTQSDNFRILYKYIRNISFGKRPSMLNFPFEFDEIEEHRYFDLFGLYYCD